MKILKPLFVTIGILSLCCGVAGIFLPVLPTTPFLLLSAWLFARSSETLHNKLITNKYVGHYIVDFQEKRIIPLRVKIISVSFMWVSISCSAFLLVSALWLRLLLFAVAVGVSVHILSFKSK